MKNSQKLSLILIAVLIMTACLVLSACVENQPKQYSVVYSADDGGYIKGNEVQTVAEGDNSTQVVAVPFEGYKFVKWADNDSTKQTRTDFGVTENISAEAIFAKIEISVKYRSAVTYQGRDSWENNGGYVLGNFRQTLSYGDDAEAVTAVPYAGYVFAGWSDGVTTLERQDRNVKEDIEVSVKFVSATQTLSYEYNGATANNTQASISLTWDKLKEAVFAVPQKDGFTFHGWCLDEELTIKVANAMGDILVGNEVLYENEGKLYAKWIDAETIVYPVLMVFVTETEAKLHLMDGAVIDVDYTMSEIERRIMKLFTPQLSKYLNDGFRGRVHFEFDTYFTTEAITRDSFLYSGDSVGNLNYSVDSSNVPEVALMKAHNTYYRTVMTTFGMNDFDYLLHGAGASALAKFASMHMEANLNGYLVNSISFEDAYNQLLNDNDPQWEFHIGLYLHEFTHTAELHYSGEIWEYHKAKPDLESTILYLLNELEINGQTVGIPFSYWEGKLDISVRYYVKSLDEPSVISNKAGEIVGNDSMVFHQRIKCGGDATPVTAVAHEGYRFVMWSDGLTSPTRHDTNLVGSLTVYAIFDKIK